MKSRGLPSYDLQRDALITAGVDPAHLYEDQASGKREDRPGLAACLKAQTRAEALKQDQVQNGTQQDTDDRRGSHEAEQADKP